MGGMWVGGSVQVEWNKGGGKWDNSNSIINKIYFQKTFVLLKTLREVKNKQLSGKNIFKSYI